jgi:hypothetical protein
VEAQHLPGGGEVGRRERAVSVGRMVFQKNEKTVSLSLTSHDASHASTTTDSGTMGGRQR